MTQPAHTKHDKYHRFPGEIISDGIWLSSRYTLRDRDMQELLVARGIDVTHKAIRQWCFRFGQDNANQRKRRCLAPGTTVTTSCVTVTSATCHTPK